MSGSRSSSSGRRCLVGMALALSLPLSAMAEETAQASGAATGSSGHTSELVETSPTQPVPPLPPSASTETGETRMAPKRSSGAVESGETYGAKRGLVLEYGQARRDPKRFTLSFTGGNYWFDTTDDSDEDGVDDDDLNSDGYADDSVGDGDAEGDTTTCGLVRQLDSSAPHLRMQLGGTWFNFLQWQNDVSFLSATVNSCVEDDDGTLYASGDEISQNVFALQTGLALRLDILPDQMLVPYVSFGGGVVLASLSDVTDSTTTTTTTTDTTSRISSAATSDSDVTSGMNHREGLYLGGGLELRLDAFDLARAADLEVSTGINDSFLVLDARYVWNNHYWQDGALVSTSALAYKGLQVTAGLKFDF